MLEHVTALHLHEEFFAHRFAQLVGISRPAAVHGEQVAQATVSAQHGVNHTRLFVLVACGQDHCTGSVTEQYAGGPVLPVATAGNYLGGNNQNLGFRLQHQVSARGLQGVEKAGTGGLHVHACLTLDAELLLNGTGAGRDHGVRGKCTANDMRQLGGVHARIGQSHFGGFIGQVGSSLVVGDNMPFLDTGPGGDPLVGRIDNFFEISVGQHSFGSVPAKAS